MRQLTEAEQDQVADIFVRHRPFIESVARQHAPTSQDVPDVVQAVGVSLCRGFSGFRGDSNIRTWLYRVTVNAARDIYRADHRHLERTREVLAANPGPEAHTLDLDEHLTRTAILERGIRQLRPDHQRLIRDDLAGAGVQTDQKTKSQRWRARGELRRALQAG